MKSTAVAEYQDEIRVEYSLTEREYVDGTQYYLKRSSGTRVGLGLAVFLIGVGLLLVLSRHSFGTGAFELGAGFVFLISTLKGLFHFPRVHYLNDPWIREAVEYWFSSTGVRVHTPSLDSTFRWSAFEEFSETEHLFLLLRTGSLYTIIPKRAFLEPGSEETVRQLLRQHVLPPASAQAERPTLIGRPPLTERVVRRRRPRASDLCRTNSRRKSWTKRTLRAAAKKSTSSTT